QISELSTQPTVQTTSPSIQQLLPNRTTQSSTKLTPLSSQTKSKIFIFTSVCGTYSILVIIMGVSVLLCNKKTKKVNQQSLGDRDHEYAYPNVNNSTRQTSEYNEYVDTIVYKNSHDMAHYTGKGHYYDNENLTSITHATVQHTDLDDQYLVPTVDKNAHDMRQDSDPDNLYDDIMPTAFTHDTTWDADQDQDYIDPDVMINEGECEQNNYLQLIN
ncbi:unnamed protein product, partial [Owenia fusiformis]